MRLQPAVGRFFREDRPCTTSNPTSSSAITTRDSTASQHENHDATHEDAPEAQAQQYKDYDARSALKHHYTISPFLAAPLLTPARATC
ncbi:hypothetical protein MVEN_02379600 [Mycena venus]|uniref:Uncharacterized protein n=1 Tax=Mycena venus TaxID=2733690 RepID=A0A8H6X2Q4_9AGAR|nr:hypothetical protein MVEN_02379600 [Mycena venus]